MAKGYFVYILTNESNEVFYTGVSGDLNKRSFQHKLGTIAGFTKKYKTYKLVYFEQTSEVMSAIVREKQLKRWNREWKIKLISDFNPSWRDLSVT